MTPLEFFRALKTAGTIADVEAALEQFQADREIGWAPLGRENNRGTVEVSADPGRSVVERLTNGIDAVLEAAHDSHHGVPECPTPRHAAEAWLEVPAGGLSAMHQRDRRRLAQKVTIRIDEGDGRSLRVVEVRDAGTGLTAAQMPTTILSLNESNKTQKLYVAGAYGQGGSSTLAVSKYTLIASRPAGHATVGFTVVRFYEPPQEEDKLGRYVYLTIGGAVPEAPVDETEFPSGTAVRHFGYDLSNYPSPLGATSVYGLLNRILFDPILPVWLDNPVNSQRRVIKGSRNALNGAVDEGDEERRGVALSHRMPLFHSPIGEFGRIGIEYWVLERPSNENKRPTAAFVNPTKPIILTLNGQNQAELSTSLIRKDAELPLLTQRLICHIDCNSLIPGAKRALFVSNREDARKGEVLKLITDEMIRALRSDDELTRLNNEARELGMRENDEDAVREMRREVSRLLRIQGLNVGEATGGEAGPENGGERPTHPRPPRPPRPPEPIELRDPPTYIRFLGEEDEPISFYPEQRRFLRIQTDANNWYHNASDPNASRINIVVLGTGLASRGSTPLQGGRMRAIFEAPNTATPGEGGSVRVELMRAGMPMLTDERSFRIRPAPPITPAQRQVTVPPFEVRRVSGPDDPVWRDLGWPDNPALVASTAEMEQGTLVIYYSEVFPKFAGVHHNLERRDAALGRSFTERYKIWLAVHSLLYYQDQQQRVVAQEAGHVEEPQETADERERQERCRIATLSAMFAEREVRMPAGAMVVDD
jgi:hypothetical protein